MSLRTNESLERTLFEQRGRSINSFQLISQILPPISASFKNNQYKDDEVWGTSNNVISIVAGKYDRGQLDKSALGAPSKGLIQKRRSVVCDRSTGYTFSAGPFKSRAVVVLSLLPNQKIKLHFLIYRLR